MKVLWCYVVNCVSGMLCTQESQVSVIIFTYGIALLLYTGTVMCELVSKKSV